ncbi:MAG: hypothetical protein MZV63_26105 [Marinilabiliales bacterium]|nr:hypothetical protein [Marinilabiliales bacterium]
MLSRLSPGRRSCPRSSRITGGHGRGFFSERGCFSRFSRRLSSWWPPWG